MFLRGKKDNRKSLGSVFISLLLILTIIFGQISFVNLWNTDAIAATYSCGKEEHSHTEKCYQNILLCGVPNDVHYHSENCYTRLTVCELEEHIHDDNCPCDPDYGKNGDTAAADTTVQDDQRGDEEDSNADETLIPDEQTSDNNGKDISDSAVSNNQSNINGDASSNKSDSAEIDNEENKTDGVSSIAAANYYDYTFLKIYYRINGQGDYILNTYSSINVTTDDYIELLAIVNNPRMNWDKPDTSQSGSGILAHPFTDSGDYIDVTGLDQQWSKVNTGNSSDNVWMANATAAFKKEGNGKVICLAVNGNATQDSLTVNISQAPSLIHIHNITVGNMNYDYIDVDVATRMLSGVSLNTATNPYILYVGATLDLSAVVPGSFSITENSSIFEELTGDSMDDITTPDKNPGTVAEKIKYLSLRPGKSQITFTATNGQKESFWVESHYPIYVKTSVKELHKNRVHEYLDIISGRWQRTWLLTDPDGTPIYVRNLGDDPFETRYLMYTDDTVILIGYALPEDNANFQILSSGVEMLRDSLEIEMDERNGTQYQKITAEFRVTTSGLKEISFGSADNTETFYINVRNTSDGTIQHCDIEIADAGAYIDTTTEDLGEGKMKITEVSYKVQVTGVKQCTVYGEKINPGRFNGAGTNPDIYIIPNDQYGLYGTQTDTQFEFSSAFGTSVESDGKRYSNPGLGLVGRSIENIGNVTSVEFELFLSLNPAIETVRIIDSDGNDLSKETHDISDRGAQQETRTVVMDTRDILDALNKCPDHSGLDFDVKIASFQANVTLRVQKDFEAGSSARDDTFIFEVYKSTSVLDYDKLMQQTVFATETINFKEGGTKAVAFDTLINDADEEIGPKGLTFHYYIKEFIPTDPGDIIYDESVFRADITVFNDNGSLNMKRANYIWTWNDKEDHSKGGNWKQFSQDTYPLFKNKVENLTELPFTGGTGTYQYAILGMAFVSAAFILASTKRKLRANQYK